MQKDLICYLCGINRADSQDHVPPKNLFPKNSQNKGYKLPACKKCNNLLHLDEEYIRDRFSIAGQNNTARQVFQEGTRKSYLRPYELLKTVSKLDLINRDRFPVNNVAPSGVIVGKSEGIKIQAERVERVAIKIVKGIYYHHTGEAIPKDHSFDVYWNPPDWLPHLLEKSSSIIGKFEDVFSYKGILTKERKSTGIWWLSFYRSLAIIVVSEDPEMAKLIDEDQKNRSPKKGT